MNRILSLLLAAALAVAPAAVSAAPAHDGYLVCLAEPVTPVLAELSGCEEVDDGLYYADSLLGVGALSLFCEVTCWATNDALTTQDCYDGFETELWNLRSVGASAGWNHTDESGRRDRLGDGVTVAVVDSGVMAVHPDLARARILDCEALSSEDDGLDDYHGTFVAGLLAAAVNNGVGVDGMVPDVSILPICITQNGGKTDVKTAVAGINKAVELGADVITFSIGGTKDNEILRKACQDAADQGVILVTCAGNYTAGARHSADRYMYPAAYDCVITVSACKNTPDGAVFDDDYSYFNDAVTVSAPGTDIRSLYLDGATATRTGTSFAAPVVAASSGLAKHANKSRDTQGVAELRRAATTDLGEPGFDPYYGHGYVSVPAFLEALDEHISAPEAPCPGAHFTDIPPEASYAHIPIDWAVMNGITNGVTATNFGPADTCTRAQFVTFLWRAAGCPAPAGAENPFADVREYAYYGKAVLWAAAHGVTNGVTPATFQPDEPVTRAQAVAFLWRYAGKQEPKSANTGFTDVADTAFYAKAVAWAVENEVTNGMTATTFGPDAICTRGQVVTFLYRAMA